MGEGVGMGTRVSSTPGPRSFTPSQRSGPHSAHVGAWFRQTGGSNGDGPSTENNPSFWRLRTDRHCRSPRSGSTGTRMEAALESFTIVTTVTSPALGCQGARVFSVRNVHHQKIMVADASTNDFQNGFHSVLTLRSVCDVPARVVRKQVRQLDCARILFGMEGD